MTDVTVETAGWSNDLIPQLEMVLQAQRADILHWQDEARRWMKLFAREVFARERGGPGGPVVAVVRAALPPDVLAMFRRAVLDEMPRNARFLLLPPIGRAAEDDAPAAASVSVAWPEAPAAFQAAVARLALAADRLYRAEVRGVERADGTVGPEDVARLHKAVLALELAVDEVEGELGNA